MRTAFLEFYTMKIRDDFVLIWIAGSVFFFFRNTVLVPDFLRIGYYLHLSVQSFVSI